MFFGKVCSLLLIVSTIIAAKQNKTKQNKEERSMDATDNIFSKVIRAITCSNSQASVLCFFFISNSIALPCLATVEKPYIGCCCGLNYGREELSLR
jgi:hypothetical protein